MNVCSKKREDFIRKRIRRLVDERGIALSAIALRANIEQGTVKALYEQQGISKQKVVDKTAEKLEKALDSIEMSQGMVKRCTSCGRELPFGKFHSHAQKHDGLNSVCKECRKKEYKKAGMAEKKERVVNNNSETAVTAAIVQRVKDEDKRDVESKYMAPYFKLTPKQLDEIRKGLWDKLLLTPKKPERADSVLSAVEALRGEVAELRREVEMVMLELGIEVKVVD